MLPLLSYGLLGCHLFQLGFLLTQVFNTPADSQMQEVNYACKVWLDLKWPDVLLLLCPLPLCSENNLIAGKQSESVQVQLKALLLYACS